MNYIRLYDLIFNLMPNKCGLSKFYENTNCLVLKNVDWMVRQIAVGNWNTVDFLSE